MTRAADASPPASPRARRALRIAAVAVALGLAAAGAWILLPRGPGGDPTTDSWRMPPDDFTGVWTVRHPDGSLWYLGRYERAGALPADLGVRGADGFAPVPGGAPPPAAGAGAASDDAADDLEGEPTRPVGRHFVYRPGLVRDVPADPLAEDVLAAVREEFDFGQVERPFLARDWRPAEPPRAPVGRLTGFWFAFDDEGARRLYAGRFVDGLQDGPQAMWDAEGRQYENTWVRGMKQGPAQAFHPNEQVFYTCTYKDDLKEGPRRIYAEDGTLQRVERFKGDKLNGQAVQYHRHGKPAVVENYLDGQLDGLRSYYDEEGRLVRQLTYARDEVTGPFTEFHPNGVPARRGEYRALRLHGWLETFDEHGQRTGRKRFENNVEVDPNRPAWVTPETTARRVEPAAPADPAPAPDAGPPAAD